LLEQVLSGKEVKQSFHSARVIFRHAMFETDLVSALLALVGVQFCQLCSALDPSADDSLWYVLDEVSLAIHRFVDGEILLNGKVVIYVQGLVAKRTHIDFLVFLLILWACMRFDGGMVSAVYLFAILAFNG
jgi:integral membrane sensor domain MASE1